MLIEDFPEIYIVENETRMGASTARDRCFRLAKGELIISLDDDSYPVDSDFIRKVVGLFERHREAGAISFPELGNDGHFTGRELTPQSPGRYLQSLKTCAAAFRASTYGDQVKFVDFFGYYYEDTDISLQLYAANKAIWFEPTITIRHHFSPTHRNSQERHRLHARNELWSVLMRCPFPQILAVAPYRIFRQLIFASTQGLDWIVREPIWWWQALRGAGRCIKERRPVLWSVYLGWIRLTQRPAYTIGELRCLLGWRFDAE
jgi:GT2 family glycosyltransferase